MVRPITVCSAHRGGVALGRVGVGGRSRPDQARQAGVEVAAERRLLEHVGLGRAGAPVVEGRQMLLERGAPH
jgi:hypothetical protein